MFDHAADSIRLHRPDNPQNEKHRRHCEGHIEVRVCPA